MHSVFWLSSRLSVVSVATLLFQLSFLLSTVAQQPESQQDFDGQITRSFTEPIEESIVSSTETGIVRSIPVREGQYVKADEVLASLDDEILGQSLRMASARASSTAKIDSLRSRMNMLEKRTLKVQNLAEGGHANPYEVEQIKTEFEAAAADFRAAQDEMNLNKIEVDRIQVQIDQRKIKSPFDGFVIQLHKNVGELVTNTEPKFATIVRLDQLKAKFYLVAPELAKLNPGDAVSVQVGNTRIKKQAKVTYVSPIIDPDSGTGRVDVSIDNGDLKLRSGSICIWEKPKAKLTANTTSRLPPRNKLRDLKR